MQERPISTEPDKDAMILADGFWIPGGNVNPGITWKVDGTGARIVRQKVVAIRWNPEAPGVRFSDQPGNWDVLPISGGTLYTHTGEHGIWGKADTVNNGITMTWRAAQNMGVGPDPQLHGELLRLDELKQDARELHDAAMFYNNRPLEEFMEGVLKASVIWQELKLARVPPKVHARDRITRAAELIQVRNPSAVAATIIGILNNLTARIKKVKNWIGPGMINRQLKLMELRDRCVVDMTTFANEIGTLELQMRTKLDRWDNSELVLQKNAAHAVIRRIANVLRSFQPMPRPFYWHKEHALHDLRIASEMMGLDDHRHAYGRVLAIQEGLGHMALRQELEEIRFEFLIHENVITADYMCGRISALMRTAFDLRDDHLERPRLRVAIGQIADSLYHASNGDVKKTREALKIAGAPL